MPRRPPLVAAVVAVVLLFALYIVFVGTTHGRLIDTQFVQQELALAGRWELAARLFSAFLHPAAVTLAVAALVWAAFRRGRKQDGIKAALVVAGCAFAARALKALLEALDPTGAEADRGVDPGFYPSGHAAVAMALCLSAILVAPGHRRAIAIGGAIWCSAEGFVIVAGRSHLVSDVLGGYLLALALALIAAARAGGRAEAAPLRADPIALLAIVIAPIAAGLLMELARTIAVSSSQPRMALVAMAAGLAAQVALVVLSFVRLLAPASGRSA